MLLSGLDALTLRVVLAVLTATTTLLLLAAAAGQGAARELRWWAAANLLVCIGVAIGALNSLPLWVHGVLGYAVIGAGMGLVYVGLAVFRGQPESRWPVIAGAGVLTLGPLWFAYVEPAVEGRVATASAAIALCCLACATRLLHGPQREGGVARWITASGFVLIAATVGLQLSLTLGSGLRQAIDITPLNLLATVAAQVMVAFGMVLMLEQRRALAMQRLSLTDPLTGLLNRAGLEHAVRRRLARHRHGRAAGQSGGLALLMFDADHFKHVNDQFGHAGGDAALAHLSRCAAGALRPEDVLARYGGEEFVAVLFDVDAHHAHQVAQRLREAVQAQPAPLAQHSVPLTVSVGVATAPLSTNGAPPLPALLKAADRALYEAKAAGRNRVVDAGVVAG